MSPEVSHQVSMSGIAFAERFHLLNGYTKNSPQCPVEVMGLKFANPFGLAAGLDKNGDYFNGLGALGFGFVEIGTVTQRPQYGNPKPRLFRLAGEQAIINRMGFNNLGVDHLVRQVRKRRYDGVLGINIGKNLSTLVVNAVDDYLACMEKVYPVADYVAINISSPNTPGLRDLQEPDQLEGLLTRLKLKQAELADKYGHYAPVVVKISPDQTDEEVSDLARILVRNKIDGVIATNTTLSRHGVENHRHANQQGGLSGAPLASKSTALIAVMAQALDGALPIIGVGGICDGKGAVEKMSAGASLVQIYSGLIYRGPALIKEMAAEIALNSA
jgi:dihydroorotate dehydrogenase